MTFHLHDTRQQKLLPLQPVTPGKVSIYICGPTVQSAPHLGHIRSAITYDILRRWLTHQGLQVTLLRNVTDIDDKILANATPQEPWWALAHRVEGEFRNAYQALNILNPTHEPHATAHIPEMLTLIQQLIQSGHAYPAADGSGTVYFSVPSWNRYGELTNQNDGTAESSEPADPNKQHVRDFALWKAAKEGEPETATWDSPWGRGRPGWHIECSAMSHRYLGASFDIHGGGRDLRFPHHENELAQSSAVGNPSASIWNHNGLVTINGDKMAKSAGNSIFITDLLEQVRPVVLRYYITSSHYRSNINLRTTGNILEEGSLAEAETAFSRLEAVVARNSWSGEILLPAGFAEAMDDDLSTPQAVAMLHDAARAANIALEASDQAGESKAATELHSMLHLLGLHPADPAWGTPETQSSAHEEALTFLVEELLVQRETARQQKDYLESDRIRDLLGAAGLLVEDLPAGSRWKLK